SPEKSGCCAATSDAASRNTHRPISTAMRFMSRSASGLTAGAHGRRVWILRTGRYVREPFGRCIELREYAVRHALHPRIELLHIGLLLRIRAQMEQPHPRLGIRIARLRTVCVPELPVPPLHGRQLTVPPHAAPALAVR